MPPISKPEPLAKSRKARRNRWLRMRFDCIEKVWQRAGVDETGWANCERCGRTVQKAYTGSGLDSEGHVHERRARSLGGDPLDPKQCLLLCGRCHFDGPSGAHTKSEGGKEDR